MTLQVTLAVDFKTYKFLPQCILQSATLIADLTISPMAVANLKVTASYSYKLGLKKNDPGPKGEIVVKYHINPPGRKDDKKGNIIFVVDGLKTKAVKVQQEGPVRPGRAKRSPFARPE